MKKLITIALTIFSLQAFGWSGDGNKLNREAEAYINDNSNLGWGLFVGRVSATADVWKDAGLEHAICYPEKATSGQLGKITAKYLEENPKKLHKEATFLIWASHYDAFGPQQDPTCWRHDAWLEYNS